jgi:hypothetical protein
MAVETVTMYDTIGQSAGNIPVKALKVGGYVTGSDNILWAPSRWLLFPLAGHVKIDQTPELGTFAAGNADVADVEAGAGTNAAFASGCKKRLDEANISSTGYCNSENVDDMVAALQDAEIPLDRVNLWLANWNLDEEEATALIGTKVAGLYVVAVQWASPSSNPNTPVPDGVGDLLNSNLDLSVAQRNWIPDLLYVAEPAPEPTPTPEPAPLPPVPVKGLLVLADLTTKDLESSDGTTWSVA